MVGRGFEGCLGPCPDSADGEDGELVLQAAVLRGFLGESAEARLRLRMMSSLGR